MFQETQRFRKTLLWAIVVIIALGIASPVLMPSLTHTKEPMPFYVSALLIIIPLVVMFLLFMMRLETEITEEGVSFFFFPLIKKKLIPWSQVSNAYVRKYNPILEFGGWGIRYSMGRNGRALNTAGNMGIQLVFTDGKKLLLGTQKPEEAAAALTILAKKKIVKNSE